MRKKKALTSKLTHFIIIEEIVAVLFEHFGLLWTIHLRRRCPKECTVYIIYTVKTILNLSVEIHHPNKLYDTN